MEIRGIGFVGSHTTAHVEMGAFLRNVLGLQPIAIDGVGAELFAASNGDVLAVAPPYEEDGSMERTIGLIVDDLDGAIAELHAAGVETDGISENARWRYSHFRMPDGKLYELVEEQAGRERCLIEPEVQLGQEAGLRPVVCELPRHELEAGLLQHAARARVVLDHGREQGPVPIDVEEQDERRAGDAPPPVLLPDPVADHPPLVGRPAHDVPDHVAVRHDRPQRRIGITPDPRPVGCERLGVTGRHRRHPEALLVGLPREEERQVAVLDLPEGHGRHGRPAHRLVARKHSVRYGSLTTPSRACSVNRSSTFCNTGARSSSERTAQ